MAKVFLSAGHGGSDPGAVAYGMKEKDINLNILLACNEVLVRHGVMTILSRTKDEYDPVSQEVKEANASGADIAVSFHTNAGKGDGSESFSLSYFGNGRKLALLCEKHVKDIGQNSRGAKVRKDLYFLKNTTMSAVLCECAFVDHDTDNNIIDTVPEQKAFGIAYAKAILEYFGIAYKENTVSTPTSSNTSESFKVKVKIDDLNIRTGPSVYCKKNGVTGKGTFTIIEVQSGKGSTKGWGKLKSGAGWISLDFAEKVK